MRQRVRLKTTVGAPFSPTASASTDVQRRMRAMLPKFAIAGLAATAFVAATALTPTGAAAGGRGGGAGNYPHYGSWNWPAYTEMNCGYVRVNGYRQKQWAMGLSVPLDLRETSQ